ncbi:MAG: DUF5979 domain-containing protein [Gemmiger formicilis]|uniref:DUF7601 domain-containing protein n=1 Tax=Gemmiger formicilis TaxID=745368 RepID=UPI003FF0A7E9|nr:DUF5979 domain-containing protein [Gemmiger formicilis]
MKKRLLAVLLACCMAAGMANAVFAADELPATAESAAAIAPADPDPPAPEPEMEAEPTPAAAPEPESEAEPTPAPDPEPESEAEPTPAAAPEPESEAEPTPAADPEPESEAEPTPAAAPEPESEAEPTPAAAPEPDMEAEPTPAPDPAATPETARTLVMDTLLAAPDTAAQAAVVTSAELVDSIRTDGCFTAKVNGSTDRLDGAVYTWYRSKDGTNWEEVPQQLCSGDAWNITPGSEHRLNAALDACIAGVRDAERLYYKVEVTGTDGAKLTAAAMQVPYCIQLQNGSFETPDIAGLKAYHNKKNNTPASRLYYSPDGKTGTFFTQYPSGEGSIVWQTTGVAKHWKTGSAGLYIELADGSNRSYNGTRNYPEASYSIDGAYDGQQFAELNCEAYGALYQDVLTAPGTTLHWSLAHRARGRGMQDSMALLIAPVDVAAQITDILAGVSSEDDNRGILVRAALDRTVQYNGEDVPIRSFMVGGEITDGNDQWGVHSGDYTVRAGQYVSRFFFLALSSGKGDQREGNLLDKVWFSTEPAPPVAGHANLMLRKTLVGSLTADELTAVRTGLTFTVTRSDGATVAVISGADMTVGTDPAQCSYTIQDLPVASESGTPYTYTVTETAHTTPAAVLYLASRAAVNGDALQPAGDPPTLADLTLLQNGTTYADFENTYARQTGSLRLTKAVDDAALRDEAEDVTNTFTVGSLPIGSYTLVYDDGTARTVTLDAPGALTVPLKGLHSVTVEDVPVGSYTVTETDHPDLASWYCTTTAAAAAGTVQVPSGGVGEAVITNTYAPFLHVTVTKQVTGGMGDTRRGFAFTAAIDGAAVTADTPYVQPYGGAALTADGFTIPHKGSIVIGHLKPGQTVTVTEETLTDYETTMDDGSNVTLGNSYTAILTGDAALTCVNNKDGVPPTGLAQDAAPAVWLLAAGAALAVVCRRRREAAP